MGSDQGLSKNAKHAAQQTHDRKTRARSCKTRCPVFRASRVSEPSFVTPFMDWREGILAYVGTGVAAVLIFPRCTEVISRAQDTHERIVLSRKRTTGPPPLVPCPQSESKGARNSLRGIAIIGALIGFIQFYNALDNDLVFDDHLAIRNNPIISRSNTTLYDVWVHDFWGKPLKDVSSHKSWRPLTTLSFKLNVLYNGGFDAASMHLTNNMLHAAVCALLAYVAYDLFRCCTTTFYAVVLFAVHPVHVEAVTGVVARSECLCALFYLLGIIAFRRAASLSYLACVVLALLSKETGLSLIGIAIVHDFVVAGGVLECVQGRDPLWTGLLPCAESSNEQDMVRHARKLRLARLWARAWFFLCFCVHAATVALYILCRLTLMVDHTDSNSSWRDMTLSTSRLIRRSENPYTFLNGTSKVLSYAFLQTKYAELLLLPREFSCEYSYDCIPAVTTYADPRNFASLALILAVLYFLYSLLTWSNNSPRIVATIATKAGGECPGDKNVVGKATGDSRSSNDDDDGSPQTTCGPEIRRSTKIHGTSHAGISHPEAAARVICFAMIVVPFLPASGLLTRIGTLVAERLLYLPSMGVCLLVGRMLATAAGQPMLQFSTSTEDYASTQLETNKTAGQVDTSVPSAPVEMGTSSADLSFGMGRKTLVLAMFGGMTAYFASTTWVRTQDWRTDETLFKSALSVCPRSAKIHQQYGQIMMNHATPHDPTAYSSAAERTEALHEAERHFKVAQDIDPQFCDLDFNFAMVASMRQDYGTAAALFRKSLPCVYSNQRAFINLQLLWNVWLRGGQNVSVHKDMAEVFEMMEKKDESVIHWRECGVISLQAGQMKAAERYFAEALRVIPDRCDIRYWQGKMYLGHAERSAKKKRTRKRLAKIDVWTTRGIESLEYCAQKRCKDSQGACIAELIKLYPSLLTSGSDRFDSLVPDAKQATLSRNFSSALLKVVDHPMVKQVAATSDLYRRISLFHRVRSGAMFALMGKLSDAIGAFDDIVLDKSNIPEQGGVMRCVVYQWIAVAAQEMYDATGDTKHFENAKQAREMVTRFSPHIRRAAAPLSEGVDDEPELAEIVRSGLRNPELARFMELTARATSKQNK